MRPGEEALEETRRMLDVYRDFAESLLAIPVVAGEKPEYERFPGAEITLSIEAMMQDGKALQCGDVPLPRRRTSPGPWRWSSPTRTVSGSSATPPPGA